MSVRQSNKNAFKDLEVILKDLDGLEGRVGWFPTARYEDGTPVAYAAAINELGYKNIPPRLGMRTTVSEKREEWKRVAAKVSKSVVKGQMTGHDAMEIISQTGEDDLVDHISHVIDPPLSILTLAVRKKREQGVEIGGRLVGHLAAELAEGKKVALSANTKPLNDTGLLISTLTHAVVSE